MRARRAILASNDLAERQRRLLAARRLSTEDTHEWLATRVGPSSRRRLRSGQQPEQSRVHACQPIQQRHDIRLDPVLIGSLRLSLQRRSSRKRSSQCWPAGPTRCVELGTAKYPSVWWRSIESHDHRRQCWRRQCDEPDDLVWRRLKSPFPERHI